MRLLGSLRLRMGCESEARARWAEAERHYRAAVRHAPFDPKPYRRLQRLYEQQGDVDALDALLEEAADRFPREPKFIAPWLERRMLAGQHGPVRAQMSRLLGHADARLRRLGEALRSELGAEARFAASGLPEARRPRVWWPKQPYPGNLGDILTPYIVEAVTGIPPRFVPPGEGLLMVGSTIGQARAGTVVWGTGTLRRTTRAHPEADYRAVRGPVTRDVVQRSGGRCPAVFGDPALLLPRLHHPRVGRRFRLGLIRHYAHRDLPLTLDGVQEIEILRCGREGVEAFLAELLACEAVLSSSLHGLILAHAYGIPALWVTFSHAAKPLSGDGGKFEDYGASVGLELGAPLDLSAFPVLDAERLARLMPGPVELRVDLDRLWASCPLL
jgi:hypothetical protein